MKIVTVVGARPQFIKAAAISRVLREEHHEILVHTGQHYDHNMSDIFFEELDIPKPDYNLGISGGTHGKMTGEMLVSIESVLIDENPDWLLVYGDTNSTLAAALAAAKLHIPVCHVEAGNRVGNRNNPEEINRTCTDHLSSLLLCCVPSAMEFLEKEGISEHASVVGDPMYDAFRYYGEKLNASVREGILDMNGNTVTVPEDYYYLTCHREENTVTDKPLTEILSAMNSLEFPTIFPVHPRVGDKAKEICENHGFNNIILTNPVGYLTSIALVKGSHKIVTDSGGLQREAFFAKKQCVTVLDFVCWPETMKNNNNQLAKPIKADILEKLSKEITFDKYYKPFGDGYSAEKIVYLLSNTEKIT